MAAATIQCADCGTPTQQPVEYEGGLYCRSCHRARARMAGAAMYGNLRGPTAARAPRGTAGDTFLVVAALLALVGIVLFALTSRAAWLGYFLASSIVPLAIGVCTNRIHGTLERIAKAVERA